MFFKCCIGKCKTYTVNKNVKPATPARLTAVNNNGRAQDGVGNNKVIVNSQNHIGENEQRDRVTTTQELDNSTIQILDDEQRSGQIITQEINNSSTQIVENGDTQKIPTSQEESTEEIESLELTGGTRTSNTEPRSSDDVTKEAKPTIEENVLSEDQMGASEESKQPVPVVENGVNASSSTTVEPSPDSGDLPVKRRSGVVPAPALYDEEAVSSLPKYLKSKSDEELIKSALNKNEFLSKLITGDRLQGVVDAMYKQDISAKKVITKEGESGTHMYVSAKGEYQVLVKNKPVSKFDDVRVFGELAILYNAKRLATINCIKKGVVWVLDRPVYQQLMMHGNIREQDQLLEFLQNVSTLRSVDKEILQQVTTLLKPEFFTTGTQIVRQGDKGDKFYIIRAGTVTISKENEGVVNNFGKGEYFGELALLKEDCRQATVTADAPGVECLTLTRQQFIDHFEDVDITTIKPKPKASVMKPVSAFDDINLLDLKIVRTLGVGGFGRVELVQHSTNKQLIFALKYLKKVDIVMQQQQEHVYNEKNIQMASRSPFIVRLYRTYKDTKYIYFLMESCLGGDLWSLLQKQKKRRFEEKEARFICACVLESFEFLHRQGIVYRDLKPENLLIDEKGYIKLTDFGFAKTLNARGKTFTFAGTPEYVAPEIVLNRGHDRAVDYWAYGVFIFEMLTGKTPFRTDDSSHMKTYNKILSGIDNVAFPPYVPHKAKHLIEKLCRPVPADRLGMQKGGIKDIRAHKWFLGFDWQRLRNADIPSPFKPKLKNPIDTQYFEEFRRDTDDPPEENSGWDIKF